MTTTSNDAAVGEGEPAADYSGAATHLAQDVAAGNEGGHCGHPFDSARLAINRG